MKFVESITVSRAVSISFVFLPLKMKPILLIPFHSYKTIFYLLICSSFAFIIWIFFRILFPFEEGLVNVSCSVLRVVHVMGYVMGDRWFMLWVTDSYRKVLQGLMEFGERLKSIIKLIPPCNIIADIGTDHAYIPVFAVRNGICIKAVATDLKNGPIRIAEKSIAKYGLENYIETRTGDGLSCIHENEADVIVIAGIGGLLTVEILGRDIAKAKNAKTLVIQPMNSIEVVREWLFKNGFEIYDEILSLEDGKLYCAIAARWTGKLTETDDIYYHVGQLLIERDGPLIKKYLRSKLSRFDKIIAGLGKSHDSDTEVKEKFVKLRNSILKIIQSVEEGEALNCK